MSLKIKTLEIENQSLKNENEGFRMFIHDDKINRQHNKNVNGDLEDKYNSVYHKLKMVDREKEELRAELHSRLKEQNRRQEQYEILKKEFNFECEKYKKEMANLTRDFEGCQKQLGRLKNSSSKDKEILIIERTNSDKKEAVLKDKINQFEVQNKELMETVK